MKDNEVKPDQPGYKYAQLRKEPSKQDVIDYLNSKKEVKPDFEKLAEDTPEYNRLWESAHDADFNYVVFGSGYEKGCEKIWTEYYEPTRAENKEVMEGLHSAKEVLKAIIKDAELKGVVYTAKSFSMVNKSFFELESLITKYEKK